MSFPPRLRQILLILLSEERLSVQALAQRVGISKRTTQRELEYIDFYLKKYNLAAHSKAGYGVWIDGSKEDREILLQELKTQNILDSANKESRRQHLALELLKDREPKKLYYFSNAFGVSESTISRDLDVLKEWFESYHLHIDKKQGMGVELLGSEQHYRTAVWEFIIQNVDSSFFQYIFESEKNVTSPVVDEYEDIKNIFNILDGDILRRVCICFSSFRDTRIKRLTQESYYELIIHVTITIERLIKGEMLEFNEALVKEIKSDWEFKFALELVNALEAEFEIEIPDIELSYICLHLQSAKVQSISAEDQDNTSAAQEEELRSLVHEIIVAYDEVLSSTLETDEEFVKGLQAHLRPTLTRVRNSFPIANPHLNEIKEIYPDIYERCKYVGRFLEARIGYAFPEAEIGLLVAHFGAAIERLECEQEKKRKVRVGLVCASGIGIARLMSSRLLKFFDSRIRIITYGYDDLTPFVKKNTDFFVSSINIDEEDSDIIFVSPLLHESDLKMIESRIAKYEKMAVEQDFDQDFTMQLERINYLSEKIRHIIKEFHLVQVDGDQEFRSFLRGVIKEIAENDLFAGYIEADIRKREEIATQIIPQLGIGLFHTRTRGVSNPCVYVCRTATKGVFSRPYMQGIQAAVFMLVPQDDHAEDNSRMLASVSGKLFEDEQFLHDIKMGDTEIIRQHLNDILRQYFQNYLDHI